MWTLVVVAMASVLEHLTRFASGVERGTDQALRSAAFDWTVQSVRSAWVCRADEAQLIHVLASPLCQCND